MTLVPVPDDNLRPSFFVRHIPVYGDLILAPLDGYSDLPFRTLCREMGAACEVMK